MGLNASRRFRFLFVSIFFVSLLAASPKLRLNTSAIGPVSVAAGTNGPSQSVDAYNAGDGSLSLTAAGSAAWLAPAVGAARSCATGTCYAIQIGLQTSALAPGVYTGTVTVSDPKALDAPQTITVTAQVGGGIPAKVDLWVPPDQSSRDYTFSTNSPLTTRAMSQSGGNWLAVALDGGGSIRFAYPYRIRVTHQPGMPEGTYQGSVAVSGSTFAPDNKTVGVTMQVTSQPIAKAAPERVALRLAQGAPKQVRVVQAVNDGKGTLQLSSATAATASGGNWLTASAPTGLAVPLTFDTANMEPGTYQGSMTLSTNAVNGAVTVPVELEVVAKGTPLATYQGVVDNATFEKDGQVAGGAIAAVFGEQLSMAEPAQGKELPLVTKLADTRVLVNGQPAPLYFTSYGQINFQMPYGLPAGTAEVRVERDGQAGNAVTVQVAERAPRLLRLGIGDYGIIVNQDGSFPMPATPGLLSRPARAGEALVIYAIGLGPTSPPAATGAAAPSVEPLARVAGNTSVTFGGGFTGTGITVAPLFVGLTPGFVGLYQINVLVPPDAPKGPAVGLSVKVDNATGNIVRIAIE